MKNLLLIIFFLCHLECNADNRALLIGIGKYKNGTEWSDINGDSDVRLLYPLLKKRQFTDIVMLVNDKATKKAIVSELKAMSLRCKSGDKVYVHFSGHGQPIEDLNDDETEDFDESIIPYDAYKYAKSGIYEGQNHLIDDEYNRLLNNIKIKIGEKGRIFISVDACYSKGMERGEYIENEEMLTVGPMRGTDESFIVSGHSSYLKRVPIPQRFDRGARLTIVSACLKTERNFEYRSVSGKMYGSLSYYIYTLLKSDANFDRWAKLFKERDYRKYKIFLNTQHPSITEYE